MAQICRICLQNIEGNNFLHLTDDGIKYQLAVCVPEVLPNLVSEPVICRLCLMTLRLTYDFICKCLVTERHVGSFYHRSWRPFNLAEMIRYHNLQQSVHDMGDGTAMVDDVQRRLSFMEIECRVNSMGHCAKDKNGTLGSAKENVNKGQQFGQFPLRECVVVLTRMSEAHIKALSGRVNKNGRQIKVSNYLRKNRTKRKAKLPKQTKKNKNKRGTKLNPRGRRPRKDF